MNLPGQVREEVRERLWGAATSIGWANLSPTVKARYYEAWTRDEAIGGVLGRYMDKGKVRVYLKDTLLKDYTRRSLADEARPLRSLGLGDGPDIVERYVKPHGVRLRDGRVVAWGRADDWKLILTAVFERAYVEAGSMAFGVVLFNATGRFDDQKVLAMVEDAAKGLGVRNVVWLRT